MPWFIPVEITAIIFKNTMYHIMSLTNKSKY
ncbi:MAG: hypothetical protein ACI965_000834 [Paraglaciecola sp.]